MSGPPTKSTISYANQYRSWKVFRDVFDEHFAYVYKYANSREKFRFKHFLFLINSTIYNYALMLIIGLNIEHAKVALRYIICWNMFLICLTLGYI
jgi:hypothetical protein